MSGDAALWLVVALLLPTALGGLAVLGRRLARWSAQRRRVAASGPTVEQLAADLRRLHALLEATENAPDLPAKHQRCAATRAAYVDALAEACRRLDLRPPAGAPVSRAEIYRVESELRRNGLDVRAAG